MISIRRALAEEADQLTAIAIRAKSHWGYPEHWMEIWKPQLTVTPEYLEQNESWIAEVDDTPIAFSTLLEKDGIAWLDNLWVLPEFMGQGVGKRLFSHAVDLSRQRGYPALQLEADPHAVGFYERMRMQKIGERQSEVDGQPRALPIMELQF